MLDSWRGSPARFREDANAEEDLRLGGYRDRLFAELAANAADAASAAGESGHLAVTASGGRLHVANTGSPLDAGGVTALASLRASAKRDGPSVGRFGVGFAAVLAVSDDPEIVSTSGGVRFSAGRTRDAVAASPELAEELARRRGAVPVLRLPWPAEARVPRGFRTEVRLPLREGVAPGELLAAAEAQAPDLLLALTGLRRITVGESMFERTEDGDIVTVSGPNGDTRWRCRRGEGTFSDEALASLGVEARQRRGFSVCWALPLDEDGVPRPGTVEVLHAPSPTDERLSVGVRLFATVPTEPGRRRVLTGAATGEVLTAAAACYPDLLTALPGPQRAALVPAPELPRSEVDATLREHLTAALRTRPWLPAAGLRAVSTFVPYNARKYSRPDQREPDLTPDSATVLDGGTGELVELLADAVPGLVDAEFAAPRHTAALHALGVSRLGWSGMADALVGVDRSPGWWRRVYAALRQAGADVAELGALPVPLADGRTMPGARGALLPSDELRERAPELRLPGLRLVHAEAVDPLLERLGARRAGSAEVLGSDELVDAVERSVSDADAGLDVTPLADLVLGLVSESGTELVARRRLGALALPDAGGGHRRADELLLPDAELCEVLDAGAIGDDGPLGMLDPEFGARHGRSELVAVGVCDGFVLVADEEPGGPDHELPDEAEWWESIGGDAEPPARVCSVRDLDLVADDRWERALELLAGRPETWRALCEPSGHAEWWLSRYALLADSPPRQLRLPSAESLTGLYDPAPTTRLPERVLVAAGVRDSLVPSDAGDVADLLARLGDEVRAVSSAVALRAYAALAEAVRTGVVDAAAVALPDFVRCVTGAVVAADDVVVLDRPWTLGVLAPERVLAAVDTADPFALAELLDLPVASDETAGAPESRGEPVTWSGLGAVREACGLLGVAVPGGDAIVHETLYVRGVAVPWWVDRGVVHSADSTDGMARALAWTLDRWHDRYLIAALLDDPGPGTVLA